MRRVIVLRDRIDIRRAIVPAKKSIRIGDERNLYFQRDGSMAASVVAVSPVKSAP